MRIICSSIKTKLTPASTTNQTRSCLQQAGTRTACYVARLPIKRGAILAALFTTLGCSMHPLPEDVSRKDTYDIVRKIRCEAAEGLSKFNLEDLIIVNTFIGYDFDFDITEKNNLGTDGARGTLTLEQKLLSPSGTFKLDVKPVAERSRQTQRTFRLIESLKDLKKLDYKKCAPIEANWAYPITGSIGINEVVETYIGLEKLTNFTELPNGKTVLIPGPGSNKPPVVFSDLLTYTTNFGASVTPELTLNSVAGSLKLTKATIGADATRKDIHKVTVALARNLAVQVDGRSVTRVSLNQGDREYLSMTARYNARVSRNADAVARKTLTGSSQVLVELERRRTLSEDETATQRLLEILRPVP
jgi:hypothetical protein